MDLAESGNEVSAQYFHPIEAKILKCGIARGTWVTAEVELAIGGIDCLVGSPKYRQTNTRQRFVETCGAVE